MTILTDQDIDPSILATMKIAVIGYGNQGHAHALNLRESGVGEVAIGLPQSARSIEAARAAGFRVMGNAEAAHWADLVMLLAPDECQAEIWRDQLAEAMRPGKTLAFGHGFAVHFGAITPREDLDVILIAPKGPGRAVRSEYLVGRGLPALVAVHQDASGHARARALAYAAAIGAGRAGIVETSFAAECETDLFGEQVVLCGGIPALVVAAFETLVEAGYDSQMAYFECAHEVKLIADLLHARGLAAMREAISNTAEYGGDAAGARIVTDATRAEMRAILSDIRRGRFARDFISDTTAGSPELKAGRRLARAHPIEAAGEGVRAMMPWLDSAPAR